MEIVLTHNNMDFDSLAAQFAVTKLYPTARILPGYPLVGNVRQFLSLYRDTLPISQLKYLDLNQITHVFIVDCQQADRLDDTAKKLLFDPRNPRSYTVFDHHHMDPEVVLLILLDEDQECLIVLVVIHQEICHLILVLMDE